MATLEVATNIDTSGHNIRGEKVHRSGQTLSQIIGRAVDLLNLTVMFQRASDLEFGPLSDVDPALTSASLLCALNGGNLAAWQAVGDGEFSITVDGELVELTGLVFTAVVSLNDIAGIINTALANRAICIYNALANVFTFTSVKTGLPASSISILAIDATGAGTDISGVTAAGFLNGAANGTITAATGGDGENLVGGLYFGNDVPFAELAAGDVLQKSILVGKTVELDEDTIVFEGGLVADDIIVQTGMTIRASLAAMGIYLKSADYFEQYQPV